MWALRKSGVRFRRLANDDGTLVEHWQSPKLPAWDVPKRYPHERRPRAPEWEPMEHPPAGRGGRKLPSRRPPRLTSWEVPRRDPAEPHQLLK